MKPYLGRQNAQYVDHPVWRVDRSLATHARVDHGEESYRDPDKRHAAHAIRTYAGELILAKQRAKEGAL